MLTAHQFKILEMLGRGLYQSQIGKQMGVSKQYVASVAARLLKAGYIEPMYRSSHKQFKLTARGAEILKSTLPSSSQAGLTSTTSYRIHNLSVTMDLIEPIDNDTTKLIASKGVAYKPLSLANHTDSYFQINSYEARLNPRSLQIHIPDLDGVPLQADLLAVTLEAYARLDTFIAKTERTLGIKVKRMDKNTFVARISSLHIALVNHKFAEEVNERGEKLFVYADGELRVKVDKSHGLNEYEAVNKTYVIEDAQKLGKLTYAVITDKFDYEKDQALLHTTIILVDNLAHKLDFYATNIEAHAEAVKKLTEVAEKASQALGRRRGRKTVLTEEHKANIIKLADTGLNYYRIAKELNLNKGSVHYFLAKIGRLNKQK